MALVSLSGLSDFLDGDRTILALIPALSVGYLHFQTNFISFDEMKFIVALSAIIAGILKDTELITNHFNYGYDWVAGNIVLIPIILATYGLHSYAIWKLFEFSGESRLYIIIFTIQILATTLLVSDIVLVLLVRAISMTFKLLELLITLTIFVISKLGKRMTELISSF